MTTDDSAAADTHRSESGHCDIERVEFETADGVTLVGDLHSGKQSRAAAIVCHPHPQYGGNRFHPVVEAVSTAFAGAGITTLRFDFRAEFGGGLAEQVDVQSAIDLVADAAPGRPLVAAGYSFGAMMSLGASDGRITHKVLIAPPLRAMDITPVTDRPTLVLTPAHDQFAPPDVVEPVIADWPDVEFQVIASVDHFMLGRADDAARRAVQWLDAQLG